jgi:MinD-like ATPase involved in chromosome partitioning or flagellar assembly
MRIGETERVGVLLASGGAAWEGRAVEALAGSGLGMVLLRRCLDVTELLAAATTGSARVAVVAHHLPGLDADAVTQLARQGTRVVAVADGRAGERDRLERIGVAVVLSGVDDSFTATLRAASESSDGVRAAETAGEAETEPGDGPRAEGRRGRVVAVWGPYGAPGRTTVAVALAAALARQRLSTFLVDSDPYGGAVAQHLGIADEVSGLLASARSANAGLLDARRLAGYARRTGPHLRVLTGLPRPDRWRELRPVALEELLAQAAAVDPVVVVDAGPGLDAGDEQPVSRDSLVTAAVSAADVVLIVAAADPVGLARAARALVDLEEVRPGGAAYVVVNRWRFGLGWSRDEVREMIHRLAPAAEVVVLPEDRAGADRALMFGRAPAECRPSALSRAIAELALSMANTLGGDDHGPAQPPWRRRTLIRR